MLLAGQALALDGGGTPAKRRLVANRIWELAGADMSEQQADSVAARIRKIRLRLGALTRPALLDVGPDEIEDTARAHGLFEPHGQDAAELRWLPREQRQAAVRGWHQWARSDRHAYVVARELVGLFDVDDLEVVVELTQASPKELAPELADVVWRISPSRAVAESRIALEQDLPASAGWFYMAPREHLGAIVDALEQTGRRPEWLTRWANRCALDGGEAAERIYELTRRGSAGS